MADTVKKTRRKSKVEPSSSNGKQRSPVPAAPAHTNPPDGGWGWMVVLSSFMISVLVDGVSFSIGIFFQPFMEHFGTTKADTSWVGSTLNGSYLTVGPVVAALANRFGCRKVAMVGSVFAAVSFFISTFSPTMPVLIVTYGFLGGIGCGLLYLPAMVMVGYYFERRRAFATGIACCGSGIGAFIFAPLSQFLLDEYTWRGATWILAGLILNCLVFSLFYLPIEQTIKQGKSIQKGTELFENGNFTGQTSKQDKSIQKGMELSQNGKFSGQTVTLLGEINTNNTVTNVAAHNSSSEANGTEHEDNRRGRGSSQQQLQSVEVKTVAEVPKQDGCRKLHKSGKSWRDIHSKISPEVQKVLSTDPHTFHSNIILHPASPNLRLCTSQGAIQQKRSKPYQQHYHTLTSKRHQRHTQEHVSNPLQRKDIYYSGSLIHLHEFKEADSIEAYRQMVMPVWADYDIDGVFNDSQGATSQRRGFLQRYVLVPLLEVFDVTLLRSPTFVVYILSTFLFMTGFFVPFIYLPSVAQNLGIEASKAVFLISIIGIANTVGRVITGYVADRRWIDCLIINNAALIVGGVSTILVPFLKLYALLGTYSFVFGCAIAVVISLRTIIIVELMGLKKLTSSFGLIIMSQGVASFIGAPIAGVLSDVTGDYDFSFYVAGSTIALGGLICFPLRCIIKWEKAKEKHLESSRTVLVN